MGGSDYDPNAATAEEKASAEVQANAYNEFVSGIPTTMAYIKDITADPTNRTAKVQGQTNADVMQSAANYRIDPNTGLAGQSTDRIAKALSKSEANAESNVNVQRLAGTMGIVKSGIGQASDVVTGMEGLAKDSSSKEISDMQNASTTTTATGNAIASGISAAAYGGMKAYKSGMFSGTDSSFLNSIKPASTTSSFPSTSGMSWKNPSLTGMGY